jgi:sialate O-acetylesterase
MADAMPYCDMAVSSDVADSLDIHPRQKRPVGERLARLALCHDYGFDIVPYGPSIRKAVLDGDKVVIEFDYADGLKTSDSQELRIFEVAGADGVFAPADAVIAEDKVILSSDVEAPEYVRYAWQPYTSANLVNGEGLPASTFFTAISKN